MDIFTAGHTLIGFIGLIAIAIPFSDNFKIINYKYVAYGILSQIILAVILLKIFGSLSAVKKASATIVTPRMLLIRISLINPANLLTSVRIATVKVDLKNEFFFNTFSMIKKSLKAY